MTLTEEQRPTAGFDLEKARDVEKAMSPMPWIVLEEAHGEMIIIRNPNHPMYIDGIVAWGRVAEANTPDAIGIAYMRENFSNLIGEIERLRASLIDLHAEYINTLEKNPDCSAWDLDEQSDADQRRLRRNAAHAISIVEPPIYLQADQQATKILELEAISRRRNEIINKQVAKIKELKADLEQSEEIKRLKDELENYGDHYACLLISKDAQIKELEGMLSIRTEELDIAHSVARSEKEMHEKELAAFARRIKELEDAHKRSGAKYAKIINELRSSVYANIPGLDVGKIGPDAKPRVWQITEERKAALWHAIKVLKENDIMEEPEEHLWDEEVTVLQAMLTEAE